jgi:hypothetical protein
MNKENKEGYKNDKNDENDEDDRMMRMRTTERIRIMSIVRMRKYTGEEESI